MWAGEWRHHLSWATRQVKWQRWEFPHSPSTTSYKKSMRWDVRKGLQLSISILNGLQKWLHVGSPTVDHGGYRTGFLERLFLIKLTEFCVYLAMYTYIHCHTRKNDVHTHVCAFIWCCCVDSHIHFYFLHFKILASLPLGVLCISKGKNKIFSAAINCLPTAVQTLSIALPRGFSFLPPIG